MSETSGFFISQRGDRRYTPAWLASYIKALVTTGVYKDELAVVAGDGMSVSLNYGRAWLEGYLYLNDAPMTMAIGNADSVLGRKDSVVVRLNLTARTITAMVLPGAFSGSPAAPEPTRNADVFDLKLAEINVPAGTTKITQDLILDTRLDDTACGLTVCTVQHIPTATFLAQMQAGFASFMQERAEAFASFIQRNGAAFEAFMLSSDDTFEAFIKDWTGTFDAFLRENKETFDVWFAALLELFDGETAGKLLNALNGHIANEDNPHKVTAAQIGAATQKEFDAALKNVPSLDSGGLLPTAVLPTVPVSKGGTGKATWTENGLIYPSGADVLAQLANPAADGSVLRQDASGAPYWTSPEDLVAALSAAGGVQIQTGSYIGTGTYGADNPCSITFDFVPKIVFIYHERMGGTFGYTTAGNATPTRTILALRGATNAERRAYISQGATSGAPADRFTWDGKTFQWYSTYSSSSTDAVVQLNYKGTEYLYIGIG